MRNEFVSPFRRSFLKGICRPENRRQFFIKSSHWHTHNWGGGFAISETMKMWVIQFIKNSKHKDMPSFLF